VQRAFIVGNKQSGARCTPAPLAVKILNWIAGASALDSLERREREADRRHWQSRLIRLEKEIREEPARIRASYDVTAHRLEPVGLVYLWPATG
jgi:hypothetical protein